MLTIRDASAEDATDCAAIYAPSVRDTAIGWKHDAWYDVAWTQQDL